LGTGKGHSVKEIIDVSRKITGHEIPTVFKRKREGDPAILIANSTKIKKDLGWEVKESLEDIIKSAWKWHSVNKNGFKTR